MSGQPLFPFVACSGFLVTFICVFVVAAKELIHRNACLRININVYKIRVVLLVVFADSVEQTIYGPDSLNWFRNCCFPIQLNEGNKQYQIE